jgi:hypothetical protein
MKEWRVTLSFDGFASAEEADQVRLLLKEMPGTEDVVPEVMQITWWDERDKKVLIAIFAAFGVHAGDAAVRTMDVVLPLLDGHVELAQVLAARIPAGSVAAMRWGKSDPPSAEAPEVESR